MNEEKLAKIEKTYNEYAENIRLDIIPDLIQALRDERQKVRHCEFELRRHGDEITRLCNILKDERLKVAELHEALELMLRECPPSNEQRLLWNNLSAIRQAKEALGR